MKKFRNVCAAVAMAVALSGVAGCAGTTDALVQNVTGQGPFARQSLAGAFVLSIEFVDEATKQYFAGLDAVKKAMKIKDQSVMAAVARLEQAKQAGGVASLNGLAAASSDTKLVAEGIAKEFNNTDWSKLSPAAVKKIEQAYLAFVSGNYMNTQLVAGMVHIARNMSTTALKAEVLPVLSGKYKGLTLETLVNFPNTLQKFTDNIDESKKITAAIDKAHDFSAAAETRKAQMAKQVDSKSAATAKATQAKSDKESVGGSILGGAASGGAKFP